MDLVTEVFCAEVHQGTAMLWGRGGGLRRKFRTPVASGRVKYNVKVRFMVVPSIKLVRAVCIVLNTGRSESLCAPNDYNTESYT
jgi:hypothetical protein